MAKGKKNALMAAIKRLTAANPEMEKLSMPAKEPIKQDPKRLIEGQLAEDLNRGLALARPPHPALPEEDK